MGTGTRPALRADAARNRELLLAAAFRAFTAESTGGPSPTLDGIAKDAGVGIGTLYRHFPNRDALVEAVYRNELDRLCSAAAELGAELPADQALRAWMDRFVDYVITKKHLKDSLHSLVACGRNPFAQSRERMLEAVRELHVAGIAEGTLRSDVDAADVLVGTSGICMALADPENRVQAGRLLDLLVDGLRPR
ncbi:TetR/AcrR family transcriptional regulator [Pseudonocardia sp. HH130630-07]|uniref:TetR/AcrR family transcriptional regulator n=1 Tax=Pseudonocardia sp. HH130630-07 TaxID=1690815 RepID=UPI000815263B|nr:TetR/AcrR family transcriptional regulator [Pseudonocardia sp. HH130630-07]ANY07867.1 transcriptional regulator [Pseudonocardia sp. HH130630-07]